MKSFFLGGIWTPSEAEVEVCSMEHKWGTHSGSLGFEGKI